MQTTRILFLAADPRETFRLHLDEEVRAVSAGLQSSGAADRIELQVPWAVRVEELPRLLLLTRPHVIHFSGHGSSAGELLLVGNDGVTPVSVSPTKLRAIFEGLQDHIRCVVLSACFSAAQAAALAQVIPCVVGMSKTIRRDAARAFAVGFYQALAFGRSIQAAFRLGQAKTEWAQVGDEREVPQLLLKPGVDAQQITLVQDQTERPVDEPVTEAESGQPTSPPPHHLVLCFSRQDTDGKTALTKHLAPLVKQGAMSLWSVDDIPYGAPAAAELTREIELADAALLLLSADFLDDGDLLLKRLREQLLDAHRQRGLRLIPILWRPCNWQHVPWLALLTPAPRDGAPLKGLDASRRENAIVSIAAQLRERPRTTSRAVLVPKPTGGLHPGVAAGGKVDRSGDAWPSATTEPSMEVSTDLQHTDPLSARQQPPARIPQAASAGLISTTVAADALPARSRLAPERQAIDSALARRVYGYGEPLLDCDRGEQWESLRGLVRNAHHELILLPGAVGQAHRFFLDRIEIALPSDPPRRVIRVDWEAPKNLAVPQFHQTKREALAALALAMDEPTDDFDELRKALHAQLEAHHLVLLHPVVNRCLGEPELTRYYCEWILELLGDSRTPFRCKLVQPIEWAASHKNLLNSVRGLFSSNSASAVLADARQAQIFMQTIKKEIATATKKNQQPQFLHVTALPELSQLLKQDVVRFLEIVHYGDDQPHPEQTRSSLADHVLAGDANSEQILQRLCRELPPDMRPSGRP